MEKRKLYIALFIVTVLAVPLVRDVKSALSGRISADITDLLNGLLIGLAIMFFAAAGRSNRTINGS